MSPLSEREPGQAMELRVKKPWVLPDGLAPGVIYLLYQEAPPPAPNNTFIAFDSKGGKRTAQVYDDRVDEYPVRVHDQQSLRDALEKRGLPIPLPMRQIPLPRGVRAIK